MSMTDEQLEGIINNIFEKYDANKNGQLDTKEL